MSDASLRAQIYSDKAKREKYKRVRSSIQSHGLDSDIDVSRYEYYVELCEKAITKINRENHFYSNRLFLFFITLPVESTIYLLT